MKSNKTNKINNKIITDKKYVIYTHSNIKQNPINKLLIEK